MDDVAKAEERFNIAIKGEHNPDYGFEYEVEMHASLTRHIEFKKFIHLNLKHN